MKRRKTTRAIMYLFGGSIGFAGLIMFAVYMYFSGTFLAGMWLIRKVLYVLTFIGILLCAWLVHEGYTYLKKRR